MLVNIAAFDRRARYERWSDCDSIQSFAVAWLGGYGCAGCNYFRYHNGRFWRRIISSGDSRFECQRGRDVSGNLIGSDITGLHPIGNASNGILIRAGAGALIQDNVIAYSKGSGVRITAGASHRITRNEIYDNPLLGLDLGANNGTGVGVVEFYALP